MYINPVVKVSTKVLMITALVMASACLASEVMDCDVDEPHRVSSDEPALLMAEKEETVKNRADLGTKTLHGPRLRLLCRMCGLRGRALQEDDPAGAGARASSSSRGASSEPDDEFVKRVLAFIARGIQG